MSAALLEQLRADGMTQLWVVYHDYCGIAHGKTVPTERFAAAVTTGLGFAKANMEFDVLDQQVAQPVFGANTGDFFALPDPATYSPLPTHAGAARTYTFLTLRGGERWAGCPRTALQRVLERYSALGLQVQAAFEPEFHLFRRTETGYEPADRARMYTVDGLEQQSTLLTRLIDALRTMGVTVEQGGPEYGPGQYEVNVLHAAPLRAADDLLTLKMVVRALAREQEMIASFMPKPFTHGLGCGLHVHLGLEDAQGRNLLEGAGPAGLGDRGGAFVAGLLAHARGLCGVGAPTVNSYKRLQPGSWAPAHVCYGPGNRAALVRVPDAGSTHVEFRAGDNTSNPYLFLTALLAAGLDGMQRRLDPGAPSVDDVGHLSVEEAEKRGLVLLPRTAPEALDALEADATIMDALGPVIGPTFLRVKRAEAATYAREVGEWERTAYLETI